jgi:hypothetical protein
MTKADILIEKLQNSIQECEIALHGNPKSLELESGIRTYIVSDWRKTCKGCSKEKNCIENKRDCKEAKSFPLPHFVFLIIKENNVVKALCTKGRKPGGEKCNTEDHCNHIKKVLKFMNKEEVFGVELVNIAHPVDRLPFCPNCKNTWSVSQINDVYECRNPTCMRNNQPWQFILGTKERPIPIRHSLVICEYEPGKVLRKSENHKRWSSI